MSWKQLLELNQDGDKPLTAWQVFECSLVFFFVVVMVGLVAWGIYMRLAGG